MIQRIQTVYLLVAAVFMFLFYMFPIAVFITDAYAFEFFNCHITHPENLKPPIALLPLAVLPVFSIGLSLFSILMFRKRKMQLRLNKLNMLFLFLIIVVAVFYYYRIANLLAGEIQYGFSGIFPVVSFVLLLMANKAINSDERLVKAADRIR